MIHLIPTERLLSLVKPSALLKMQLMRVTGILIVLTYIQMKKKLEKVSKQKLRMEQLKEKIYLLLAKLVIYMMETHFTILINKLLSQLWCTYHEPEKVVKYCKKSVDNLGLGYLDLYLIHWPFSFKVNITRLSIYYLKS